MPLKETDALFRYHAGL